MSPHKSSLRKTGPLAARKPKSFVQWIDNSWVSRLFVFPVAQLAKSAAGPAERWPAAFSSTNRETTVTTTSLNVNGRMVSIAVDDPDTPLLYVLRNELS